MSQFKLITFAVVALVAVSTVPAGAYVAAPSPRTYCADGDRGKGYGSAGGACTCAGYVYYCDAGNPNSCQRKNAMGSVGLCNYQWVGEWHRRSYGRHSQCYCHIPGCDAGKHGPPGSCTNCGTGKYQSVNQYTGSVCHNCGIGKYQNQNGGTSCKQCQTGRSQGSQGQASCGLCKYCLFCWRFVWLFDALLVYTIRRVVYTSSTYSH